MRRERLHLSERDTLLLHFVLELAPSYSFSIDYFSPLRIEESELMLYYPIFNIIEKMRMTNELRVIRMRRIQKKCLNLLERND